jgi:recombination protein RecA
MEEVMEPDKEKDKAVNVAVTQIEKQFGKGAIMRLGAEVRPAEIQSIPTGSLGLDLALGVGGLPRGMVAEAQKEGIAAFVDAEHALDLSYAERLGVQVEDLLVSQPDTGEQALEIVEILVRSGAVDVIVVDSVAALVPRAEIEGDMGDTHVGLQARLMSQALRKLAGTINKSKAIVVFINQIRMKIGVMFGNPETTPGGNALKFYSTVRLDIRRIAAIKQGQDVVGNRTRVRVVKNKVAPPFKEVQFDIIYGKGISREGEIVDLATDLDIIEKMGTWYSFGDTRIGQGRENAKTFLSENPEMREEIVAKIMERHTLPTVHAHKEVEDGTE